MCCPPIFKRYTRVNAWGIWDKKEYLEKKTTYMIKTKNNKMYL